MMKNESVEVKIIYKNANGEHKELCLDVSKFVVVHTKGKEMINIETLPDGTFRYIVSEDLYEKTKLVKISTFDSSSDARFLSNFYPSPFEWKGYSWKTVEHAYQAAKSVDSSDLERFSKMDSPAVAKAEGRSIENIRPDWEDVKYSIMQEFVELKFRNNPDLAKMLLDTKDAILEEGNHWKDTTWGICPPDSGNGKNWLGIILMDVREKLKLERM